MLDDARLRTSDVLVIGAGMAGLAAAQEMLGEGLTVTVLDPQPLPGGKPPRPKPEGGGRDQR